MIVPTHIARYLTAEQLRTLKRATRIPVSIGRVLTIDELQQLTRINNQRNARRRLERKDPSPEDE